MRSQIITQLTFTCLKSTIETQDKRFKICSKLTRETPFSSVSIIVFKQVNASCASWVFSPYNPVQIF